MGSLGSHYVLEIKISKSMRVGDQMARTGGVGLEPHPQVWVGLIFHNRVPSQIISEITDNAALGTLRTMSHRVVGIAGWAAAGRIHGQNSPFGIIAVRVECVLQHVAGGVVAKCGGVGAVRGDDAVVGIESILRSGPASGGDVLLPTVSEAIILVVEGHARSLDGGRQSIEIVVGVVPNPAQNGIRRSFEIAVWGVCDTTQVVDSGTSVHVG